jgi:uroporphyrinogen decarboxylase
VDSRERIRAIIAGQEADRCGFWLGNPYHETWPIYHRYFATADEESLRVRLRDDFRWIPASTYRHPTGRGMFDIPNKSAHGTPGPFAECDDPGAVDELYEWPNPDYLDFDPVLAALRQAGPYYRASGFWAPFYHHVMDLFGMEKYMMNMYLNPELVQRVTDRVCSFYHQANERFFDVAGNLVDGYFFGNDFGTQRDLICGPAQFDQFVMPWFLRFTEQAHARGYQVILHSCGSVAKVIDRLIAAGVECLHPLQALAADMDAESLAVRFGGRISFLGGVDTQELLVHGTPQQVRDDVRRLKRVLGPRLIVSPSHEALLPNVPPENVLAMAEAATE